MGYDYTTIIGHSEMSISSDAVGFYKDYWKKGKHVNPKHIESRRKTLEMLFPGGLRNRRIVELGLGGEGGFLYLLNKDNETFGFDASESAVELCLDLGLDVSLQNLDVTAIPLRSNSVDIVFAMEVFEHFASPQFVIEEIKRVLKPEGTAIISTPNPLIYHWPQLFYPELFNLEAFRDFLMVNSFQVQKRAMPQCDEIRHVWHWIWIATRLGSGAQAYFEHGLHFWNQKFPNGVRKKPIEAIGFFHRSHLSEPGIYRYRAFLARALLYRFINGDTSEFTKHYSYLIEIIDNGSPDEQCVSLYHLAMMYVELLCLGRKGITKETFDEVIGRLKKFDQGPEYIDKIMNSVKCLSEKQPY